MINGKRIAVVMPAYNAAKTLEKTVSEVPETVDLKILVDDHSSDDTVRIAEKLGLRVYVHEKNYGYGRNQQTCYKEAIEHDRPRCLRRGLGFQDHRWRRPQRRHAFVQIHC